MNRASSNVGSLDAIANDANVCRSA